MNLGERIYSLRSQAHMSQGDLADALDVSRQSVSKWENGNAVPELDKLIKMAELFGVSLDELVGRESQTSEVTGQTPKMPAMPSVQRIIGILLLAAGLLCIPLALSASAASALGVCLVTGGFFLLSGAFCLTLSSPYMGIGWAGLGTAALFLFAFTPRWERKYFAQAAIWLGVAAMIFWTILVHRSGKQPIPTWIWWLGGLVLSGFAVLYCMNMIPR